MAESEEQIKKEIRDYMGEPLSAYKTGMLVLRRMREDGSLMSIM